MHFNRLGESYSMVESNLHFDKVTLTSQTGLTGLHNLPISVVNSGQRPTQSVVLCEWLDFSRSKAVSARDCFHMFCLCWSSMCLGFKGR